MPETETETEPAAAASAHRRRKECLSRLSALDERHAQLHALEQRLRCLERDIRERVELAGRVTGMPAEARSDRTIAVLVDRSLARCEGTALEDDEYETDF